MRIKQRGVAPRMIPISKINTTISMKKYRWSAAELADNVEMDIEKEIMQELTRQITAEMDRSVMRAINAPFIAALEQLLLDHRKRMRNFIPRKVMPYSLSFKKHLGEQTKDWETKLDRFMPVSSWSYMILDDDKDALFYFSEDEDRVAFLLLMR